MTLIAKPVGRGNFTALRVVYPGPQLPPPLVCVGHLFTLCGVTWRVLRVEP